MNILDDKNNLNSVPDKTLLNWYKKLYNIENESSGFILDEKTIKKSLILKNNLEPKPSESYFTESQTEIVRPRKLICKCKERLAITKKVKSKKKKKLKEPSEGRIFLCPQWSYSKKFGWIFWETFLRTFKIKYDKKLSLQAKILLKSFDYKYLYHAIDDIFYSWKLNSKERENLLTILYSPALSLQNNVLIDFFDIWIDSITISKMANINNFLTNELQNVNQSHYITIKLRYRKKNPYKKQEILW